METTENSAQPLSFLAGLGGLAACGLGFVYGYGALEKATELHGANQDVTNTLPLVPLQQLLVAGISRVLPLGAIVVFGIAGYLALEALEARGTLPAKRNRASSPRSRATADRIDQILWLVFLPLFSLFLFFFAPPWGFLLILQLVAQRFLLPHLSRARSAIFLILLLGLFTLSYSYLSPNPLPKASLRTQDGKRVSGDLIATDSGTWYIGTDRHRFVAIQNADIRGNVRVQSVKHNEGRSTFDMISGSHLTIGQ